MLIVLEIGNTTRNIDDDLKRKEIKTGYKNMFMNRIEDSVNLLILNNLRNVLVVNCHQFKEPTHKCQHT